MIALEERAAALLGTAGGGLPADRDDGQPDRALDPRRARYRARGRGDRAHHDLRARRRRRPLRASDPGHCPATAAGSRPSRLEAAIRPPDPLHGPHDLDRRRSRTPTTAPAGPSGRSRSCRRRRDARELGLAAHLDGARRIANAAVASGVPAAEMGRLFDTVTLCLSKGLGAPLGRRDRRLAPS